MPEQSHDSHEKRTLYRALCRELERRGVDHERDAVRQMVAAMFPRNKTASELADIWQAAGTYRLW